METAGNMSAQAAQISVSPELSVRRGRQAIEFYKAALGALEIYRVGGTEEDEEVVAQLSVGNASFWVSDESPPNKNFSPESSLRWKRNMVGCWAESKTPSDITGR